MAVAVEGVVHFNVNCSDLARSLAFYHERIGLRPLTHTAPEKPQGSGFGLDGGGSGRSSSPIPMAPASS